MGLPILTDPFFIFAKPSILFMKEKAAEILLQADIKATPNRILVLNALLDSSLPLSLIELETELETLERSSVLRVLSLFAEHHLVHALEDGRGITKYEVCHSHDHDSINDLHVHFYCEKCGRTFCFEDKQIPDMNLPSDFHINSANFMFKGICPDCGNFAC